MPNFSCPTCRARNGTDWLAHNPQTGKPMCSWCGVTLPADTLREALQPATTGKK